MLEAKGANGQVTFDGSKVVITRKGLVAKVTQGLTGEKSIGVKSISAIQFKRASALINGYIQFNFVGSQDPKGGVSKAIYDENTIMFRKSQEEAFSAIRSAVETAIFAPASKSSLDDLERLSALRASGALTDEEFQAMKRRALTSEAA